MIQMSPYDKRTEETRRLLDGGRENYCPNHYYRVKEGMYVGCYYCIDAEGYYHILTVKRPSAFDVRFKGKTYNYEVVEYLLTTKDVFKEVSCRGNFTTYDEGVLWIEDNFC